MAAVYVSIAISSSRVVSFSLSDHRQRHKDAPAGAGTLPGGEKPGNPTAGSKF